MEFRCLTHLSLGHAPHTQRAGPQCTWAGAIANAAAHEHVYDLSGWPHQQLVDTLNSSVDVAALEACRVEVHRRLKVAHARQHASGGGDGAGVGGSTHKYVCTSGVEREVLEPEPEPEPEPPCLPARPAGTGQACAYVSEQLSSRGRPRRCASRVGAGWRTCLKHTCADPGCGEPKPSSTQFCPRHGAANASRPHDGAVQHRPGPDLGTRASAAAAPATRSAAAAAAHGGAGPPAKPARVAPRVPDNGPGPDCFLYDNVREALPGARPRLLAGPVWRREWCGAPTAKATPPSPPLFDPLIFTAVTFERPYEVEA